MEGREMTDKVRKALEAAFRLLGAIEQNPKRRYSVAEERAMIMDALGELKAPHMIGVAYCQTCFKQSVCPNCGDSQSSPKEEPYAVLVRDVGEDSFFDRKPTRPGSLLHRLAMVSPEKDYVELYTK
jgi:hypothetical protein